MKTVWKFLLRTGSVSMPKGARLLHVALQDDTPCLWALVDPEAELELRDFRIVGTGSPLAQRIAYSHVGTFLENNGDFVWHVFEINPPPGLADL